MARQTSKRCGAPKQGRDAASAAPLLAWYDQHRRTLPWRALPNCRADPYAVWLSEIMLQQTTVAAVKAYFATFLTLWPRVEDLAAAPIEDIMRRWAGLGYYSRARNLHACAKLVAARGGFPQTEGELRGLPGIGPYTAAAVAAIAFDAHATVVDGNVERVIVRLYGIEAPVRDAKAQIRVFAEARTPDARCGDYAQAMMDLGATICTPRRPACVICPLSDACVARRRGLQAVLPAKAVKPARPLRHGSVFYVRRRADVLVRTRPANGLLGGMTEFPGSEWDAAGDPHGAARPLQAPFAKAIAPVEHGFTHFELYLSVYVAAVPCGTQAPAGCRWVPENELPGEALPSLMRKVATAGQAALKLKEVA